MKNTTINAALKVAEKTEASLFRQIVRIRVSKVIDASIGATVSNQGNFLRRKRDRIKKFMMRIWPSI